MIKTLSNLDLKDKKVLLRIDINAPVVDGKILDEPRIKEAAKTIKFLLEHKAKLTILAHQGRKSGKDFLDLNQHSILLSKYSGFQVKYVDELFGQLSIKSIQSVKSGESILLKNVRSDDYELNPEKDSDYKEFCKNFDIYVNDAFSVSHRSQSSIILPPKYLPSYIGINFEEELEALKKFSLSKKDKQVFLIGGAKVEDYISIFEVLKNEKSIILASGVLANLFYVAQGGNLGYENSWLEEQGYNKLIPELKKILEEYEFQIILPVDFAVGDKGGKTKERKEILVTDLPTQEKIWDVGEETIEMFKEHLKNSKQIFMKGPLGFSEMPQWSEGTTELLKEIGTRTRRGAFSLLGGGHLTTTLEKYKIKNDFSHISTAGGALIAYLSGKKLPGLEALEKSN